MILDERQEFALKMLTILQGALEAMSTSLKETLDLIRYEIDDAEPKIKARGIDYKILEIMKTEPEKEWLPSYIVDRIRAMFPDKSREQLLSTSYLALSRLHNDGHLLKLSRGIYKVVEGVLEEQGDTK